MPADVVEQLPTCRTNFQPFSHQVAGQSLVFQYDAHTLCKSLVLRENQFYQSMSAVLLPHVPEYRGFVTVPSDELNINKAQGSDVEKSGPCLLNSMSTTRAMDKIAKRHMHDKVYYFVLLENIVAPFRVPCILDLKIGTRQYGDDATPEKVAYLTNKNRSSTSSSLGLRLCGMKVYRQTTKEFTHMDKLQGHLMKAEDFRRAVHHFFHNGCRLRQDAVAAVLQKLVALKKAISALATYRFYGSSLLIVYEGDDDDGNQTTEADVDFQSDVDISVAENDAVYSDDSVLQGNTFFSDNDDNVDVNVATLNVDYENKNDEGSERRDSGFHSPQCIQDTDVENLQNLVCSNEVTTPSNPSTTERVNLEIGSSSDTDFSSSSLNSAKTLADVRMVDFAHATFAGFGSDQIVHSGVDHGCLLGVQTLINILTELQQQPEQELC